MHHLKHMCSKHMDPSWKYLTPQALFITFFPASPMSHLHTWCSDVPFQPCSSKLIMDSLIYHGCIEIKIRLRFTEGNAMRGGRKRGRGGGGVAGLGTECILLRHSCAREWLSLLDASTNWPQIRQCYCISTEQRKRLF